MQLIRLTPGAGLRRRLGLALAGLGLGALLLATLPCGAPAESFHGKVTTAAAVRKAARHDPSRGASSSAAEQDLARGYLAPEAGRTERQKARADRDARAARTSAASAGGPSASAVLPGRSWQGIANPNAAPPEATSAVGTTRYIELINHNFAIYDKTGTTPLGTGQMSALAGVAAADTVRDAQIIWDPTTSRFYFAATHIVSASENRLAFGFSRTASPNGAADWCKYSLNFGAILPNYPRLGDSRFFMIVGSNLFNGSGTFAGADLTAISKPSPGAACPAPASFKVGDAAPLMVDDTHRAVTPVAANEIDTKGVGWAVARAMPLPATQLSVFRIDRNANTGKPVFHTTGRPVPVPSYSVPPNAPQRGSVNSLETLDGRLTQAVASVDPIAQNKMTIWTQHTVNVDGRAAVRWYEISPWAASVLQSGAAARPALHVFNGAISSNRRVNGTTQTGGGAMVLSYNTSSAATLPAIGMVSKIGAGAQSAPVVVKTSSGPLSGLGCNATTHICLWGDQAGASPDPAAGNRTWQVSQFSVGSGSGTTGPATARTWHFVASP
jgi:hypothetical protein